MKWLNNFKENINNNKDNIKEYLINNTSNKKEYKKEYRIFKSIQSTYKKASLAGVSQILKKLNSYEKDQDIIDYMFCGIRIHGKGYIGNIYKPCVLLFRKDKIELIYSKASKTSRLFFGIIITAIRELNPKLVNIYIDYENLFNQEYIESKYQGLTKTKYSLKVNDNYQIILSGLTYIYEQIKNKIRQ